MPRLTEIPRAGRQIGIAIVKPASRPISAHMATHAERMLWQLLQQAQPLGTFWIEASSLTEEQLPAGLELRLQITIGRADPGLERDAFRRWFVEQLRPYMAEVTEEEATHAD